MRVTRIVLLLIIAASPVYAGETDQFLVWGVELDDSAEPLNEYLNETIRAYLNEHPGTGDSAEEVVVDIYFHLFNGLFSSRVRQWLQTTAEVDRYPDESVSWWAYQSESIYNRLSFPYLLPLSRTIRIGDVYCGIDKFGHFFGFGRRFFNHYIRLRAAGMDETAAHEAVIRRGVLWENLTVGKLVDGIFSHADIEASYQGMLLARDLADGASGHLVYENDRWCLIKPMDIRKYITPDFDESYNPNHYWALRKCFVVAALNDRYFDAARDPAVQDRFARYRTYPPSFCRQVLERHFDGKRTNPQRRQYEAALGLPVPNRLPANGESHIPRKE